MNLEKEKRLFILTYAVYILATVIMVLIIIGFTLIPRQAVRSFIFLISYIVEVILLYILAIRKKIRNQKLGYVLYISLLLIFSIFTLIYLYNKIIPIMNGLSKVING